MSSTSNPHDDSAILAAYHEALIQDATAAEPGEDSGDGLDGALNVLRMMERNRQLSQDHVAEDESSSGDSMTPRLTERHEHARQNRIGRFLIIRKLGAGGNGVVFLATDRKLSRDVALKVPKPEALLDTEFTKRFRREANLSAKLNHPHIVTVHETGSVGPVNYIASAYCNGPTLAAWLKSRGKPVSPRSVAQLGKVLSHAVQHAHSRGILHRDLKPSNVMFDLPADRDALTEEALHESARLTDFGLAKHVDDNVTMTQAAAILGTPAYMSPEQAAGKSDEVGTHSDIFALGCVIHELLIGTPPFRRDTPLATLQAIRNDTVSSLGSQTGVPRDLAAITLKCLQKRPGDRYSSAAMLSQDLDSFLNDRPVSARSITPIRRLARWARSNPILSTMVSLVLALLITIAVGSSYALVSLTKSSRIAKEEAINKIAVSNFLSDEFLGQASPMVNPDRDLSLLQALDLASQKLEGHFKDQPLVESKIRFRLGTTYSQLARYDQANEHLDRAYRLATQHRGADHADTLRIRFEFALVKFRMEKISEAASSWRDILTKQRDKFGDTHADTLRTASHLGYACVLLRRFDDAQTLFEKAESGYLQTLGADHPDMLECLANKARMLQYQEQHEEAELLHARILAARERLLGEYHPHYLDSLSDLASVKMLLGKSEEAVALFERAVALRRRVLGKLHPDTLADSGRAATAARSAQLPESAERLFRETLAAERSRFGPDDERTLSTMRSLSSFYMDRGRFRECDQLRAEVLDSRRRLLGDHPFTVSALRLSANAKIQLRLAKEVEALHREMIAMESRLHGENSRQVIDATLLLTYGFQETRQFARAEKVLTDLLERLTSKYGRDDRRTLACIMRLAYVHRYQLHPAEAEELFREAWERSPRVRGPDHRETLRAGNQLGSVLRAVHRFDEAEPILGEVLKSRQRVLGDDKHTLYSLEGMAKFHNDKRERSAATDYYRQAAELRLRISGVTHRQTVNALRNWFHAARRSNPGELPDTRKYIEEQLAKLNGSDGFSNASLDPRTRRGAGELRLEMALAVKDEQAVSDVCQWYANVYPGSENIVLLRVATRFRDANRLEKAEELLQQVIEQQTLTHGSSHRDTLEAKLEMAYLYEQSERYAEAEALLRGVWEKAESDSVRGQRLTAGRTLARVLNAQNEWRQAEVVAREVVRLRLEKTGEFNVRTADAILQHANALTGLENFESATACLLQLAKINQRLSGGKQSSISDSVTGLQQIAIAYEKEQAWREAIRTREHIRELKLAVYGIGHVEPWNATGRIATLHSKLGDWQTCYEMRSANVAARRDPKVQSFAPLYATYLLGESLYQLKRLDEATTLLKENIAEWEMDSPSNPRKYLAYELLGRILIELGQTTDAQVTLLHAQHELSGREGSGLTKYRQRIADRLTELQEKMDVSERTPIVQPYE